MSASSKAGNIRTSLDAVKPTFESALGSSLD